MLHVDKSTVEFSIWNWIVRIARLLLLDDFDPFIDPIHYGQLIAQLKLHVVKVAV